MEVFLLIVHVITSIAIIVVILLQSGKGGGLGSGFGGAGAAATQIFGGRGAGNFLSRTTVALAAIFMATSLSLAYISSQPRSLMDLDTGGGPGGPMEDEIIESGSGAPDDSAAVPAQPVPTPAAEEPAEELEAVPAPGADDVDGEAAEPPPAPAKEPAAAPAEEATKSKQKRKAEEAPAADDSARDGAAVGDSAEPAAPGASTEEETLLAPAKADAPESAE